MLNQVFSFQLPRKIIFGNSSVEQQLCKEIRRLGGNRVLIVTDNGVVKAGIVDKVKSQLAKNNIEANIFDKVQADPPIGVCKEGIELLKQGGYNLILGLGGGSSLDTAKTIAIMGNNKGSIRDYVGVDKFLNPAVPMILIPTTAGTGSEVSNAAVLFDETTGSKISFYDQRIFADSALLDPLLTLTLPPKITAETGLDAFTHAIESYFSVRANPFSEPLALRAIEMIGSNLRTAYAQGGNIDARYNMLLGSMTATMSLRSVVPGMAIHALSYPIAADFKLSHGLSLALLLPSVMRFNMISNLNKFANLAKALGENINGLSLYEAAEKSIVAVECLIKDVGAYNKLSALGAKETDFYSYAEKIVSTYVGLENNSRRLDVESIVKIYQDVF